MFFEPTLYGSYFIPMLLKVLQVQKGTFFTILLSTHYSPWDTSGAGGRCESAGKSR